MTAAVIDHLIIENDHFSWYRSSYDWTRSHQLILIALSLKMMIFAIIDHLIAGKFHFRWYWTSYDWKQIFPIISIVLWLKNHHFPWYWSSYQWKRSFPVIFIVVLLIKFISHSIDHLMTDQDHFHWNWSSYSWTRSFRDIDPLMTENDHLEDIDLLITNKVYFPSFWSSYDWTWSFLLILIVLLLIKFISHHSGRLMTENDHLEYINLLITNKVYFPSSWSSHDWTRSFSLILIVLWLKKIISANIDHLLPKQLISADIDRLNNE
jgi:hypothetical protein